MYTLEFSIEATHARKTGDCDTDGDNVNDAYCASETYTFIVGSMVDLEVRDVGSNLNVSADQRAFTIRAINNGPDTSEGAEVTVSLPPGVSLEKALPGAGRYDAARGVWTLDELREGLPQTLTLITDAAEGTEITAAIANTAPYTVCIDSSGNDVDAASESACTAAGGDWHEGTVFDHLDSNNSATIAAIAGASGAPDTAPGMVVSVPMDSGANLVYWTASETGDRHRQFGRRQYWDIDYSDDGGDLWQPLVHHFNQDNGHRFLMDGSADESRTYRVRARYASRVGDWTEQGQAQTAPAGDPGVTIWPTELTVREDSPGGRSYSVRLEARPTGNVVIDLFNSNMKGVSLSARRLVFTPSDWRQAKTVSVKPVDDHDTVDEVAVISHVINQDATSADYAYFVLPDVTVTVDDEDTAVQFTACPDGAATTCAATTQIGVDEGGTVTYYIALDTKPPEGEKVTVSLYYPSGEVTAVAVDPPLQFTSTNYDQRQEVMVYGVVDDDTVDDETEICHSFSEYSNGKRYAADQCLDVVVTDNRVTEGDTVEGEVKLDWSRGYCPGEWPKDESGNLDLSEDPIIINNYPEEGGGCFYSLRLNKLPTVDSDVTVRVQAINSSKVELDTTVSQTTGEMTPGRLTFTTGIDGNWREPQEIGFWPVRDDDAANNNDFTIEHRISGGGYNGVTIPDIVVKVKEADEAGFRVEVPPGGLEAVKGDRSTSDEDLYQAVFYMFPETQPTSTVTVDMSSDNPGVTLSPSRLSFTPSNWDEGYGGSPGKRVIVRAAQDAEDAEIEFTVTSSDTLYDEMDVPSEPVRVVDDEPENTGEDGEPEDQEPVGPASLTGLTVASVADEPTKLDVSWNAVSDAVGYWIQWKTGAQDYTAPERWWKITRSYKERESYRIEELDPNTFYHVKVSTVRSDGTLGPYEEATARTAPAPASAPPTGGGDPPAAIGAATLAGLSVAAVTGEPTQLSVSWDQEDDAAKYSVRWKTGSGDYGDAVETTTNSYTVTGLSAGTTYTVNVAALDGANTLLAEAIANGTTSAQTGGASGASGDPAEPTALGGLTVSPVSGETTKLTASWNAVAEAEQYLVQWKTGDAGYNSGTTATTNSHTLTGLSADTAYTVQVTAIDTDADPDAELATGEASGSTLATMGTVTVAAVTDSSESLDVSWPAVDGAVGYVVEWKTGGGAYTAVARADAAATTERITGLAAGTAYTVRVTARHTIRGVAAAGDSAEGSGTTNAPPADDAPAAEPAVSFVIYHDADAGEDAVDRYNQAVTLLTDAGIAYTEVTGDVRGDASKLAGVTDSVMPRFFLGDPTGDGWTSEPGENNGGLRWLKGKVAELSGD